MHIFVINIKVRII